MKQIIQDLRRGNTILEEVPAPMVRNGCLLIKTHRSLVSLGTERMLVDFGKANIINKARQQPERVKDVLNKIRTEGLAPTISAVINKLDEPLPLGYSNAGEVIAVGEGVTNFKIGDRVASNGPHAEIVCVPKNLCARIPNNVSYDQAAFTVIGAIALQGIRLAAPAFGETVVVVGLGLIGLITAELLGSNGCRVIGFDFEQTKVDLARKKNILAFNAGVCDPVKQVEELTNRQGCDAVIITASTKSDTVISQSAQMSRKRGRIILVGVVGMNILRSDFYKKELSFQVSCSYGPGRYDSQYEEKGMDYPYPYVRWTEQRNFEAVLEAMATGRLDVVSLISNRKTLDHYLDVYKNLSDGSIATVLEYTDDNLEEKLASTVLGNTSIPPMGKTRVGIIGAGNFTKMTLLPALKGTSVVFSYISSAGGLTAKALANKYGFNKVTTDYRQILNDPEVDMVIISTRHNLHAPILAECLMAQKHVFVEKPLAVKRDEINMICGIYDKLTNKPSVTVGFNRRFSPFVQKARELLGDDAGAINMIATMNAGHIFPEVWVHDMEVGGGRIIGEACHYIDLMIYLSGSLVKEVNMSALGTNPSENTDNAIITLKFENGSQGVLNYFSNGSKEYPKERIEVYSQQRTLILDNFRKLSGYGFKGFSSLSGKQDKGHKTQFANLISTMTSGGPPLIPFHEIINSSKACFAAIESMQQGKRINID